MSVADGDYFTERRIATMYAVLKLYAVILVILGILGLFYWRHSRKAERKEAEEIAKAPKAIIIVTPDFDMVPVAAAAGVFEHAGLGFKLVSNEGGPVQPDAALVQTRQDPIWLAVLSAASTTATVSSCFSYSDRMAKVIFIPGGPNVLGELQGTEPNNFDFRRKLSSLCLSVLDSEGAIGTIGDGAHALPELNMDTLAYRRVLKASHDSEAEALARALVRMTFVPESSKSKDA